MAPGDSIAVLIVASDPEPVLRVREVIGAAHLAASRAEVEVAAGRKYDFVVATFRVAGGTIDDFLPCLLADRAREELPRLVLLAEHRDLARVATSVSGRLAVHVLPQHGPLVLLRRLVALKGEEGSVGLDPPLLRAAGDGLALVVATLSAAARIPGAILRDAPRDGEPVELVVPAGRTFGAFEREARGAWGNPVTRATPGAREVLALFGEIEGAQRIHAVRLDEGGGLAFFGVLAWSIDDRVTLVAGIHGVARARAEEAVARVHAAADRALLEYVLPPREGDSFAAGHAWFVTREYVGPERRAAPTSFFNRYAFVGRRARVLVPGVDRALPLADRLPRWAIRCVVAYLVLTAIDAALTLRFVVHGPLHEMNPLMRALIAGYGGWPFLVAKNVGSIAAIAVVSRYHLARAGAWVLALNVAGYALLDAYWLVLLAR